MLALRGARPGCELAGESRPEREAERREDWWPRGDPEAEPGHGVEEER